jgi:uncharacterized repeat protein (TIGR01451 family)
MRVGRSWAAWWFALLATIAVGAFAASAAFAQTRTFTSRFSTNKSGDILIVGNTLMTCPGSCGSIQNGTNATATNLNNNSNSMIYTNSEGFAAISTPFTAPANSSRATLNMPFGSTVEFAGLYWGGDAASTTARNRARFITPLSDTYVTATQLDTSGTATTTTYQGFVDVTTLVRNAGNGTYIVGNVQSTTGTGRYAGWSLVVVYSNTAEQARNLTVFDGMQAVSGTAVNVAVGPFITPPTGPVNARVGVVAYEGDLGTTGDALRFNGTRSSPASSGTQVTLSDGANPATNFFNSSISRLGSHVTGSKTPDYINQLGFDIDVVAVPNSGNTVIRNGDNGAVVNLSTSGDAYYPGVVTTAIDVFLPNLTAGIVKTMQDLNGGYLAGGDVIEYTLSFTNTGNDFADNTVLTDPIPANTAYVPGSMQVSAGANAGAKTDAASDDQCEYVASTPKITCRLGTGANATNGGTLDPLTGTTSVKFRVQLNAVVPDGTTISNTATVSYRARTVVQDLTATTNLTAAATGPTDLGLTKAHTGNFSQGQQNAEYRLTVSNAGATTSAPFQVVDTLPAGMSFLSGAGVGWACSAAGQIVTCNNNNSVPLAGGATNVLTLSVNVSSTAGTPLVNTATASGGGEAPAQSANNDANDSTIVSPRSDLTITKTHTGNFAQGATGRTYTIVVTNSGGATNTGTTTVTDSLPAGLTATALAGSGWTCTLATLTCTRADNLNAGASYAAITLTVTVGATTLGPLDNVAQVSGGSEVNTTNNTATDTTNITPSTADLVVAKTHSGNFAQSQTDAQYTLTVTNSGLAASTTATISVVDTPPAGMTVTAMSGTGWTCTVATRTCTRASPLNSLASFPPIVVTVSVAANAGSPLINSATVSGGGEPAANNTNNTAADPTIVTPLPDLTVAKSHSGNFTQGQLGAQYSITVTNAGFAATSSSYSVIDTLPAGMTFVSGSGANYACGATGQVVTCANNNLAPLAAAGTSVVTLTVNVSPNATATLVNSVSVSGGGEVITTNNSASDSTTINPYVGISVVKSFAVANVNAGAPAQLTITLGNTSGGPLTLTSAFVDSLPTTTVTSPAGGAMVVASPNGLGGTCSGVTAAAGSATITTASGSVVPAGGCTIVVNVSAPSSGTYTNTIPAGAATTATSISPAPATASINVYAAPTIAKAFAPSPIAPGGTSTLTFTLTNPNAAALTNANFTDPLNNMTLAATTIGGTCAGVTASPALAIGATSLNLTVPNLLAGSCTIAVQVTSSTPGALPNTASGITTVQTTAGPISNTATLTVNSPPLVTKTFLTNPIAKDAVSILSIAITNPNTVSITGAAFTDNFPLTPDNKLKISNPTNTTNLFTAASVAAGCTGTTTGAHGGQVLSLTSGTIPAGVTCTIQVGVVSSSSSNPSYANSTGPVTTANAGIGTSASDTLQVVNGATIDKSFSPSTIVAGGTSQLTIVLATTAGGSGSPNAAFTDTYPQGLVNTSGSPIVANSCGGTVTAAAGAGSIALAGGTIPANSTCSIIVSVTSSAPGAYVNTIPVGGLTTSSGSPNNTNTVATSATLTVTAAPQPPTIAKTFAASSIVGGGTTQLTLSLGNTNASAITLTTALIDTLPTSPGAMTVASPNNLSGTCSGISAIPGSGSISIASGTSIPPGGCTVTVDITATVLGSYTNTIAVGAYATSGGSNASAATATLYVPALPTISQAFAPTAIAPGGTSTLTFSLGNANAVAFTNASFTASLTNVSIASPVIGGTCAGVTNNPALAVGATALNLSVPVLPAGGCTITVQVTSSVLGNWPSTASGITASEAPVAGPASNTANLQVMSLPPNYITGTVFEDVNYGGGTGRSLVAASGVGVAGARVELFNHLGTFLSAVTTDASGGYAFTGLATGNYTVRVPNLRVASTRPGSCQAGTCIPVQTFRTDAGSGTAVAVTDRVGGQNPGRVDAGDGTSSLASLTTATTQPQSITTVALGGAGVTGVDFGFNFSTIVDDRLSGQGTLEQFVINSNALGGESALAQSGSRMNDGVAQPLPVARETSIFMVSGGIVRPGLSSSYVSQLTSGRVLLNYASGSLTTVTGSSTIIDGTTQTFNVGDTNAGAAGAGGQVGVDALPLEQVQRPEVELQGNTSATAGLEIGASAANSVVRGLSIWRFGSSPTSGNVVLSGATSNQIEQNIIGSPATGFSDPGAGRTAGACLRLSGGTAAATIINNLIGFCTTAGIVVDNAAGTISDNEVRGNASATAAGIRVLVTTSLNVIDNLIAANGAAGIELGGATTTIQNNTIASNGTSGVSATNSSNNIIYRNIVSGNGSAAPSAGVAVSSPTASGNRISQNSIYANNALGIDLGTSGVTANDGATGGANNGMDYPIFTRVALRQDGVTLILEGYVGDGPGVVAFGSATIELFVANNDGDQSGAVIVGDGFSRPHGEGHTYVGTIAAGADGRFSTTLNVSGLAIGSIVTATATRCADNPCATAGTTGNTSEFAANFTVSPEGIDVRGMVYADQNHNGTRDGNEVGSGLALFAKLLQGTNVIQVAPVSPATSGATSGIFTFSAVVVGPYSIIIDDNGLTNDVSPTLPAGWIATLPTNLSLPVSVTQSNNPMPNFDFGVYHGSRVSGTVFGDTGTGTGGIANDQVMNGTEAGIAGVSVRATGAACGAAPCDVAVTDASGRYNLYVAASVGANAISIVESNLATHVSVGGRAGTTGGTYDRTSDTTSFANVLGASYTAVNFADVPAPELLTDGAQNGMPGVAVFYAHTFTAGTVGSVSFTLTNSAAPATTAWTQTLYRDSDCSGTLDGTEGAAAYLGANTAAGETICVLVKQFIPAGAPLGAVNQTTLTATFTYLNAAPPLTGTISRVDLTTVGSQDGNGFALTKTVDKTLAKPNEVITYTITFTNNSAQPMQNVVINDATPQFTTYVGSSAGCPALIARTTCSVSAEPTNGAAGTLRFVITGSLAPSASGTVRFQVRVAQ